MARRLAPTDLPLDAPSALEEEYNHAKMAIKLLREAEADVARKRREAVTSVERYELALLRHRGQMTLFEDDT